MKSLMLKLLTIITLLSSAAFADAKLEEFLIKFEKQRVGKQLARMGGKLKEVTIILKKELPKNGWSGYVMQLDFTLQGKTLSQRDTVFSNGELISMDLISVKNKMSFKNIMYPTLTEEFYNKKHLIAGSPDAQHKLVLFSDPLCPICIDEIPYVMKKIIDNPKNIALYYYHMPLKMHPTAKVLSKASILATKQGIKNVDYRIYRENFPEKYKFDAYKEKDEAKVLNFFNKEFGTKITMAQINNQKLNKLLAYDEKMSEKAFVNGTPTLFFDGEYDITRSKFEKYLK
jgi:thiol:disulfide interchange protein DsbC